MKITLHQFITDDENGLQCFSSPSIDTVASAARDYMNERGADLPEDSTVEDMLDHYSESGLGGLGIDYMNLTSQEVDIPLPDNVVRGLFAAQEAIEFAHEELFEEFREEGDDDDEINSRDAMMALAGVLAPLEAIIQDREPELQGAG